MKKVICLLLFSLCIITTQKVFAKNIADTTGDNQLTQKEKQQGWQLLFDGTSLNGWRTYKNLPGSWQAKDGTICSERSEDNKNADLITDKNYGSFELSIDWKISPKGNSGIMYHVTEDNEAAYESGPEYQLIDDDGFPEHIEDWQKTGAAYAIQPPAEKAANAPGEWNTTIIKVNGAHVEHWLNGKKVVDYTLWSDEWKKAKANGKWKDDANYGMAKSGHIALQYAHSNIDNTYICFKNIKIKTL